MGRFGKCRSKAALGVPHLPTRLLAANPFCVMSYIYEQSVRLRPHPTDGIGVLDAIAVDVRLDGFLLTLTYHLDGGQGDLVLPPCQAPSRADGLWQNSCCEAFLKAGGGDAYFEMNFSPSSQWAVYHFDEYRAGMKDAVIGADPIITLSQGKDGINLEAQVDMSALPAVFRGNDWQLGLSCVLLSHSGSRAYWAINHPPEKPDFHHHHCFAHRIGAAERA